MGRPAFDFDNADTVLTAFAGRPWRYVINAAAYTAVDAAEADEAGAARANADGPQMLATLCALAGIPLIHISTDYVFDGAKGRPLPRNGQYEPDRGLWPHQAGGRVAVC